MVAVCCLVGNLSAILLGVASENSRQNVFLGFEQCHLGMGWPKKEV